MKENTNLKDTNQTENVGRFERVVRRHTKFVRIALIKMDRYPLNPSTLDLIKHLENGGKIPPIKLAKLKDGGYLIRDGRHRITASKLLGREYIEARFSEKPMSA